MGLLEAVGKPLFRLGCALTYLGISTPYKAAFGPFEIEPYEKARIEAERASGHTNKEDR